MKTSRMIGVFLLVVLLFSNVYLHLSVVLLVDDIYQLGQQIRDLERSDEDWMFRAIQDGDEEKFNSLLPVVDVNYSDESGVSFLHTAVANDNITMVRRLLENGANVNTTNRSGWTVFHLAVYMRNEEVLKIITAPENKPNIHQVDTMGNTPMELAKDEGYQELIEILEKVK